MPNDNPGVQEAAVTPAQDIPESTSQDQVVDQPQVQTQTPETETGNNEVSKDNAAFAAMRVENKRLKETLESIDPEYLNKLRGATAPQPYTYPEPQKLDADADYSQVTERLNWSQQQSVLANQRIAQLQNQLEKDQDRRAEEAFPELRTDKVFQQIVAEKKLAARVLGSDRTTYDIAQEVNALLHRREEQVAVAAAEQQKQNMLQKQVVTAESKGNTSNGQSSLNNDETRHRVRKGDMVAQEQVARNLIADLEF